MAGDGHTLGFLCTRCGFSTPPRGGREPRFCAVCGLAFAASEEEALAGRRHYIGPALTIDMMVALFAGLLAMIPAVGLVFGPIALGLAVVVLRKQDSRGGWRSRRNVAVLVVIMGIAGGLANLLALGGLRCAR